jgi:hypothetical protein
MIPIDKVLTVKVKPGWKTGTKVTYPASKVGVCVVCVCDLLVVGWFGVVWGLGGSVREGELIGYGCAHRAAFSPPSSADGPVIHLSPFPLYPCVMS